MIPSFYIHASLVARSVATVICELFFSSTLSAHLSAISIAPVPAILGFVSSCIPGQVVKGIIGYHSICSYVHNVGTRLHTNCKG